MTALTVVGNFLRRMGLMRVEPEWNKSEQLHAIWDLLDKDAEERLGTVAEAEQTMQDCRNVFSRDQLEHWSSPFTGTRYEAIKIRKIEEGLKGRSSGEVLGHTNRVSRLMRDRISLGYVIKTHLDGYQLESFEALDSGLVVLRLRGTIVAAYPTTILRCESRPGLTIG